MIAGGLKITPVRIKDTDCFRIRDGINKKCLVFKRWEMGKAVGYDVIKKSYGDDWLGIEGHRQAGSLFSYSIDQKVEMIKKIFELNK